jgi:tryptophan-rich sensory protein
MVTFKEHFKPLLDRKAWWTFGIWAGINALISIICTIMWMAGGAFSDTLNLFLQGFGAVSISSIVWIGLMYETVGKKEEKK